MASFRCSVQRNLQNSLGRVGTLEAKSLAVGPGSYVHELRGRPEIRLGGPVADWRRIRSSLRMLMCRLHLFGRRPAGFSCNFWLGTCRTLIAGQVSQPSGYECCRARRSPSPTLLTCRQTKSAPRRQGGPQLLPIAHILVA